MGISAYCSVCGNEKNRMNDHKMGCVSCYASSGPDWILQWLVDASSAPSNATNVIGLDSYRAQQEQGRQH